MKASEFDALLIKSEFLKHVFAEVKVRQEVASGCADVIAMIATAAARQMNADVMAQNLERMEALRTPAGPSH